MIGGPRGPLEAVPEVPVPVPVPVPEKSANLRREPRCTAI
jgi:hypothetical protein